jgi:hypothetical protein
MLVIIPNVGIHTQKSMLKINILYQMLRTPLLSTLVSHFTFCELQRLVPIWQDQLPYPPQQLQSDLSAD